MPPVLIAIVAYVAAGAIGASGVWGALAALAVTIVGNAILASASNTPAAKQQLSNRLLTVRQPVAPWPVIFGQARVGGTITFLSVGGFNDPNDNAILNVIVTIAGHQIKAITMMYFDGVPVPLDPVTGRVTGKFVNLVDVAYYLGDPAVNGYASLAVNDPARWTSAHRQKGRAGVYLRLFANASAFPGGIPNITFDVLGYQAVYDPRTGTTGFTDNAALCVAAYLADKSFGFGADPIAEFSAADLIEAANICDTIIAMPVHVALHGRPGGAPGHARQLPFIAADGTLGGAPVRGDQ